MTGWILDLRHAVQGLKRSPILSVVIVTTLALGVGLNAAIFSVVDAVLLRPLPYPGADRLVYLQGQLRRDGVDDAKLAGGLLDRFRARDDAFAQVEGIALIRQNLTGSGSPRQTLVAWSSPRFLQMLGVEPRLGRLYGPEDPPGTVVLSHRLWVAQFGSDPDVVGRSVRLDGHPSTVVGVLPANFRLDLPGRGSADRADLWKNPDSFWQNGDVWHENGAAFGLLQVLARLQDGVTIDQAQAATDALVTALRGDIPAYAEAELHIAVAPLHDQVVKGVRSTLLLLLGAVGFVLLIACANVANLLLARVQSRRSEMALRMALGSSTTRVGRLMLTESLLLASMGAAAGVAVAHTSLAVIRGLGPADLPFLETVGIDGRVLAFGLALVGLVTVFVGLVPARRAARAEPGRDLRSSRAPQLHARGMYGGLVVAQVALSLVLLIGAGLLTGSLLRMRGVDPGFDTEDMFSFSVTIPGARYGFPDDADRFYRALERRIDELPGVSGAGTVWPMPFSGSTWTGEYTAGDVDGDTHRYADYVLATEAYFSTVGIPVVDGDLFADGQDRNVAVVSRSLAERAWPGQPAVGRTVMASPWGGAPQAFRVIGVVEDVRAESLADIGSEAIYFDSRGWSWVDWEVDVLVQSSLEGTRLIPALREAVASLDPEVPLAEPAFVTDVVRQQSADVRFALALLGIFAGVAAVLAVIGLYGVVAYTVGRRKREIGIRMALGSARRDVLRLVLAQGARLVGPGLVLGLAGALLLTRFLDAFLFGVAPTDPVTFLAVAALLGAASFAATLLPARAASRVDPVEVLRGD